MTDDIQNNLAADQLAREQAIYDEVCGAVYATFPEFINNNILYLEEEEDIRPF